MISSTTKNKTSYKTVSHTITYNNPPIKNIDEFESKNLSLFSNVNVIAIEKLKGKRFNNYFDGKQVEFMDSEDKLVPKGDDYLGYKNLFYEKYAKSYVKLVDSLQKVPFNLHGEIIGLNANEEIDICFYDIYLNSNWMDWKDFSTLMNKHDLPIVSTFYFGRWKDEEYFYSLVDKLRISGMVVRPEFEDLSYGKRVITKFSSEKFRQKNKEVMEDFRADIRLFMFKEFTNACVLWEARLITSGIDIKDKKNFSTIMKIVSKLAMEEINDYLADEYCYDWNDIYTKKEIVKVMKKELPSMIKHLLKLDNSK